MKVRELIVKLLDMPLDAEAVVDTEDGMTGNYQAVDSVALHTNALFGSSHVAIGNRMFSTHEPPPPEID